MKKYLPILALTFLIPTVVWGVTVFNSNQVGTSPTNGKVLQTDGTSSTWVATSSLGISGSSGSGGTGNVSTSSVPVQGNLSYWTTTTATPALLGTVATSSLTATAPIALSQPISVIGIAGSVITCAAASGSVTGCLSSTDWTTFNNKQSAISTSTNPLMATYFVATSTSQPSIFPFASTTVLSTNYASSTKYFGADLSTCDPTTGKLLWASGIFSCGTDAGGSGASLLTASSSATTTYLNTGKILTAPMLEATSTLSGDGAVPSLRLPYTNQYTMQRTLTQTSVTTAVDIGAFTLTHGTGLFEFWISVPSNAYSQTKRYFLPASYNGTNNVWQKVSPISTTGVYSGTEDMDLEINTNLAVTSFRLRRTLGGQAAVANITIIHQGVSTDTFAPSTAQTTGLSAPTVIYLGNIAETFATTKLSVGGATLSPTSPTVQVGTGGLTLAALSTGQVGLQTLTPAAQFQVLSTVIDSGSYSLSNWNGTGQKVTAFFKTPSNAGPGAPAEAEPAIVFGREGSAGNYYGNFGEILLRRWENNGTNARTAMDFATTHGNGDAIGTVIMSLLSNQRVGIASTTPGTILSVAGVANFAPTGSTMYSTLTAPYYTATSTTATSTFSGNIGVVGALKAGDYYSGDGTIGFTGTCTLLGLTSITVKDGLITGCQ